AVFIALSSTSTASDFTPIMAFLLVPFALAGMGIWAVTWPTTKHTRPMSLKILIRTFGLCLIFTPTHTPGGNGQMASVALYDIVFSALGGDSVYARQAFINVVILTPIIALLLIGIMKAIKRSKAER
ncbi:hypothetical protein, partial [Sedimenticola sp.]